MVHPGPALAGVGSGTLLGPEGSAARSRPLTGSGGGVWLGFLFLPLLEAAGGWLRVLVGCCLEQFVICVD